MSIYQILTLRKNVSESNLPSKAIYTTSLPLRLKSKTFFRNLIEKLQGYEIID